MSGLQNVRSSKRPVTKKHPYIYAVLVVGGNPQVLLQPCLQAVLYSLFWRVVLPYITIIAGKSKNDTLFVLNRNEMKLKNWTF